MKIDRRNRQRLLKIETEVHEETGLTVEDVELILSVLPTEIADAVRKKLLAMPAEGISSRNIVTPARCRNKVKERSGLRGANLNFILKVMPPESAEKLLVKLACR